MRLRKLETHIMAVLDDEEAVQQLSSKELAYSSQYLRLFAGQMNNCLMEHLPECVCCRCGQIRGWWMWTDSWMVDGALCILSGLTRKQVHACQHPWTGCSGTAHGRCVGTADSLWCKH